MWRAGRLGGKVAAHAPRNQFLESGPATFPLRPEEAADTTSYPFIQLLEYTRRFAETKVAAPACQIAFQRAGHLVDADPARALRGLSDF